MRSPVERGARVGIVGGGMLGMTLALRLAERGHRATVIEAAPEPGGLAAPQELGGFTWDRFYHVILLSDANLRRLLGEIGLEGRLRWGTTRTGFYVDGGLVSLSSNLDFLRFPALSALDKGRLALTILRAAHLRDWRALEEVTAEEWLIRWSGRRTYERIWQPLLRSKLGEHHRDASAAFIWAIIARMYAARRSGLKREMFGYVDGGYAAVLAGLRRHLEGRGVEFACGRAVTEVLDGGDAARVRLADGDTREFDDVVLTVSCPRVRALCPQLTDVERDRLGRVVYQGVVCASLLLRRPLAGYYVTNITDPSLPFTGVIEMTALVDRDRFGGHTLVYLPRYLGQGDPRWRRTDAEWEAELFAGLARLYPVLRRDDVVACHVSRVREVLAISTLGYSARAMPPVRTSLSRVFVVNSAQIANGTLNVNETIGLADAQLSVLAPLLHPAGTGATASAAR